GLLAGVLTQPSVSAATATLRKATVKAIVRYTTGKTAGTLSTQVVALSQEAMPMIASVKVRLSLAVVLAMTLITAGAGLLAHQPVPSDGEDTKQPDKPSPPAKLVPEEKKRPRVDRFGDPLPADAVARLGTVRLRHGGQVNSIVFSPDGKLLASAGDDAIR